METGVKPNQIPGDSEEDLLRKFNPSFLHIKNTYNLSV